MDLYLFPTAVHNKTVNSLLDLREGSIPPHQLYPDLFEFAAQYAYTAETAREYAIRALLRNPPSCWREDIMRPYLDRDIETVFKLFFRTDWDAVCKAAGMLPLPRNTSGGAPGERRYKHIIAEMVRADSADSLSGLIIDFLREYLDENEAMYRAFLWDNGLNGVSRPDPILFDSLCGLEFQKKTIIENTRGFLDGFPANDILLIGGGGSGKSSCVKAALNHFAESELRLAELSNNNLAQLPALTEFLSRQKRKYIIFIDDLSFENADQNYLALKAAIDGQISERPKNVLIYATSNRRHLVRESWKDRDRDEDIHENDTVGEKVSLSGRFGIRLYFSCLSRDEYLDIVRILLKSNKIDFTEEIGVEALAWATANNGRSGRSAQQFARNYRFKDKA